MTAADWQQPERRPIGDATLDSALHSFTDEARRDEAQRQRQHLNDSAVVSGLSGTFVGTLIEIAESAQPVLIITRAGSHHRGAIAIVGRDVVVFAADTEGRRVLLRTGAIEGVRELSRGRTRPGPPPTRPTMASLLDDFSVDRCRIAIVTTGGNRMMGTLVQVGVDQVTLALDGDAESLTIPVNVIDEAVIEP